MTGRSVPTLGRRVDATVAVPGSKSIANRALICAALADGPSTLRNVPDGDDTAAMIAAMRTLGIDVAVDADVIGVGPVGTGWPAVTLDAGLAGTTSRFLTALAALGTQPITIDGAAPLRSRPFGPLHGALTQLGASVVPGGAAGHLPVRVSGPPRGRAVQIRGDVSSQFISALMMIGPLLGDGLEIELTSPLVSVPYVELTAAVMSWFGVGGVEIDRSIVTVPSGTYRGLDLTIEPDASSASYPLAVAAVGGGRVTVPGLGIGALQGDARFAEICGAMGAGVARNAGAVSVEAGASLRGIDIDMADVSDLVPTVAVMGAFAETPTRVRGVGFIRAKESDRLGDLAAELSTLGVDIVAVDDGLDIGPSAAAMHGGQVATHHDHRLAMAFAVLGTRVPGVIVHDPDVVSKSWPGFWDMLHRLGSP